MFTNLAIVWGPTFRDIYSMWILSIYVQHLTGTVFIYAYRFGFVTGKYQLQKKSPLSLSSGNLTVRY